MIMKKEKKLQFVKNIRIMEEVKIIEIANLANKNNIYQFVHIVL